MREEAAAPAGDLGKYDLSFDLGEPERYRAAFRALKLRSRRGHFALDTAPGPDYADRAGLHEVAATKRRLGAIVTTSY